MNFGDKIIATIAQDRIFLIQAIRFIKLTKFTTSKSTCVGLGQEQTHTKAHFSCFSLVSTPPKTQKNVKIARNSPRFWADYPFIIIYPTIHVSKRRKSRRNTLHCLYPHSFLFFSILFLTSWKIWTSQEIFLLKV